MTREEAIAAIAASGKTVEQAEAFLNILRSAFRRRGWVDGEPLTKDALKAELATFVGAEGNTATDE